MVAAINTTPLVDVMLVLLIIFLITIPVVTLPDRGALEAKLAQAAGVSDQPEVHVRPNKRVEYKAVATVLASAQRLGVTKLGMVGSEQFVK